MDTQVKVAWTVKASQWYSDFLRDIRNFEKNYNICWKMIWGIGKRLPNLMMKREKISKSQCSIARPSSHIGASISHVEHGKRFVSISRICLNVWWLCVCFNINTICLHCEWACDFYNINMIYLHVVWLCACFNINRICLHFEWAGDWYNINMKWACGCYNINMIYLHVVWICTCYSINIICLHS